jgi:Cu+-exporting ATPase
MPVGKQGERLVTIPVTGMTCASCVRRVERALSKRQGVAAASVNFAAEEATVEYDPEAISPEDLIGTIEDAGYGTDVREATFGVTGMSCASCVGRVERALGKVPGVLDVSVNLANEKATVRYLGGEVDPRYLEKAVEGAGYGTVSPGGEEGADASEDARGRDYRELKGDFVVAAVLTVLIFVGSLPHMLGVSIPISMTVLNWTLLALATPVQFWTGRRFYKGAWGAL